MKKVYDFPAIIIFMIATLLIGLALLSCNNDWVDEAKIAPETTQPDTVGLAREKQDSTKAAAIHESMTKK